MFDVWAPEHSVLREKVIEHIFLAELSKVLLLDFGLPFDVLRPEFDANGYDAAIEAGGVLRHVQFKAMRVGGKRRHVDVALALTEKPSGCVIWLVADPTSLVLGPFYWLGGKPGEPMPSLGDRITRHSKANSHGEKAERVGHRRVPIKEFETLQTIKEVAVAMFGTPEEGQAAPRRESHDQLLRAHLQRRGVLLDEVRVQEDLRFGTSADIAHLIDGYELAMEAGLTTGDDLEAAHAYVDTAKAEFERTQEGTGTTLELWVTLFFMHRIDKFSGAIGLPLGINLGDYDPGRFGDEVCRALAEHLS